MTTKLCPICRKALMRYWNPSNDVHFWGHPHSFTAYGARELCDYSEPESTPRCPKRKREGQMNPSILSAASHTALKAKIEKERNWTLSSCPFLKRPTKDHFEGRAWAFGKVLEWLKEVTE